MTKVVLGKGEYSVSASHRLSDGLPSLTIHKLPAPVEVGTLLEPGKVVDERECEVVIDVLTPEAAAVLLTVASGIAFAHGLKT